MVLQIVFEFNVAHWKNVLQDKVKTPERSKKQSIHKGLVYDNYWHKSAVLSQKEQLI